MIFVKRPASKFQGIIITLVCSVLCFILASLVVFFIIGPTTNFDNISFWEITTANNVSSCIAFGLSALLIAYLAFGWIRPIWGFGKLRIYYFILSLFMMFAVQPFVEWGSYINETLCNYFHYDFEASNDAYNNLIVRMIDFSTPLTTIVTVCTIALLPAIFEEMFFRGIVQQSISRILRTKQRLAIIITAIIFSLAHSDLSGLIPRIILGITLGIIFFHTRNLTYCITAHFANNLAMVIILYNTDAPYTETLKQTAENPGAFWPIISFIYILTCFAAPCIAISTIKAKKYKNINTLN